jgi:gluconokinase
LTVTIIVFGVTGSGKTSIGKQLARQLGWTFYDADDFHSPASVEKMRSGIPLTDDDRWPWLDRLRQLIADAQSRGEQVVLACSALKRAYRERLSAGLDVTFIYLEADRGLIAARLRQRTNHFMNPQLLTSQFEALEEPARSESAVVVSAADTPDAIVEHIRAAVKR